MEDERSVLLRRAKELALRDNVSEVAAESIQVVEFRLGKSSYSIESENIVEIIPAGNITPLPFIPPFIAGIIYFRGRIVSVVDLKNIFKIHPGTPPKSPLAIIVSVMNIETAILADQIVSAHALALSSIEKPISTLSGPGAEYVKGITSGQLIILDVKRMLAGEHRIVNMGN